MNYIKQIYRGRIGRKNYILGVLFLVLVFWVLSAIAISMVDKSFIALVILFAVFAVHVFSLHVRRFHDIGQSGSMTFLFLIPLVGFGTLIYSMVRKGEDLPNQFGNVPSKDVKFLDAILNKDILEKGN